MPPPRNYGSSSGSTAHTRGVSAGGAAGQGHGSSAAAAVKGRRGSKAAHNSAATVPQSESVEVENFGPPEWRTVLNNRADLGWPDFYPSRPGFGQPEDVLTEENVKNGYVARSYVAAAAESFSMRGPLYNTLCNGGLDGLAKMGQEVLAKRDELMPQITERAFRIPPRVTYNDTKRFQFLADAGNPAVPLHRLMRDRIPHGFKGIEALDAVFAPPVAPLSAAARAAGAGAPGAYPEPFPLDRAVWFIRALGANEVVAHRLRVWPVTSTTSATSPGPVASTTPGSTAAGPTALSMTAATPVQLSSNEWYSIEFSNTFTSWLRVQLGQLVLPAIAQSQAQAMAAKAAVKPTAPPAKGPGGVLGDEKSRTRWLQKWEYSLALLRELHSQRLVSSRVLVGWFADFLGVANLAQLGFVAQLINDYAPDVVHHLTIGRAVVRAACQKIKEIRACPAPQLLGKVDEMLRRIVNVLYDADSEILLGPTTWRLHSDLLLDICGESRLTSEEFVRLRERNERLHFKLAVLGSATSSRRNQMEEISKLDSISAETDMTELCRSFFDAGASPTAVTLDEAKFEDKVFILLNWSMGLYHLGIHRPYATYTMLRLWTEQREEHLSHTSRPGPVDLFPVLYRWLDISSAARKQRNVQAIGLTFGEFTRQGLYSYSRYLQTLIAHGHTTRSRPEGPRSHHLDLLRAMPIFVVANDLLQQRRIALSGDSLERRAADEEEETAQMDAFREECKEYVPELYGYKRYGRSAQFKNEVDHRMPSTEHMTRFIFLQARFELAENSEKRLKRSGKTPAMDSSAFVRVIQILHLCQGYSSIADFLVRGLRLNNDFAILRHIVDTLHRHADVFTAMDRWPRIVEALLDRFYKLDRKDVFHPRICRLLLELAADGRVNEDDAAEVQSYLEYHEEHWLKSIGEGSDPKPSMPAVRKCIVEGDVNMAVQLGSDLYDRHGPFDRWGSTWWETVVHSLRSVAEGDVKSSLDAISAMSDQLCTHLALSIDGTIGEWLDSLSMAQKVDWLGASPLTRLLLALVTRRRLSLLCILDHLVYGMWKQLSKAAALGPLIDSQVQAVNATVVLVQQLFLTRPPNPDLPPFDQEEALIAQTSRAQVFTNAHTPDLIRHLPLLVVLGSVKVMPEETRDEIAAFFQSLSLIPEFKTAIFRHLGLLKDAFLTNDWSRPGLDPAIEAGMIDTLKGMMSEGPSSGKTASMASLSSGPRLSAWRWTSIVLEMRVEFKRLALRIDNGEEPLEARETLRRLVGESLNRETSPDDADLLCETFRGIDTIVKVEILAAGLERLGAMLGQLTSLEHRDEVGKVDKAVDLVLRVIESAGREDMTPVSLSDHVVLLARQRLVEMVAASMVVIERQIVADPEEMPVEMAATAPEPGVSLRIVLKVLRFMLGLGIVEGNAITAPRPDFARLAVALLRAVVAMKDVEGVQDLQDVLAYVIDSAPPTARANVHTALMAELSSAELQNALRVVPSLRGVLPYQSPHRRCMQLQGPAVPDDGSTVPQIHLDERPWELFDYMAPLPGRRRHGEQYLASRPIKDSASIPAALFNPLVKRDALPGKEPKRERERAAERDPTEQDESEDERWLDMPSERSLGNGAAGEPIGAKGVALHIYTGPGTPDTDEAERALILAGGGGGGGVGADPNYSPMTTTSTSSVPLAAMPRRQSTRLSGKMPAVSASGSGAGAGTDKNPIAIEDDEEEDRGSSSDSTSSDEPQVVERPPAKRPRVGSKTTATATVAGRATTGGKAPAKAPTKRATTGGKMVGRKAVAGKAPPRGTGGKSTKSTRR